MQACAYFHSLPNKECSQTLEFAILMNEKQYVRVDLICISLIKSEAEHVKCLKGRPCIFILLKLLDHGIVVLFFVFLPTFLLKLSSMNF